MQQFSDNGVMDLDGYIKFLKELNLVRKIKEISDEYADLKLNGSYLKLSLIHI